MPSDLIVPTASNGENLKLAKRFVQDTATQDELIDLSERADVLLVALE